MQTILQRLRAFNLYFLLILHVGLLSCNLNEDYKPKPLPNTPPDLISYDELGSGTIVFNRSTFKFDGDAIVGVDGGYGTYVIDVNARTSRVLNQIDAPLLSPDGKFIAYVEYGRFCQWDIHVVNKDGSNDHNVSLTDHTTIYQSWNGVSGQILFFDTDLGLLYSQSPFSDKNDRKIIYDFEYNWQDEIAFGSPSNLVLSPFSVSNSEKLSFCQRIDSLNQEAIFSMDISGENVDQIYLADEDDWIFSPNWSPDGMTIAFLLFSGPEFIKYQEIVLINVNSKEVHSILKLDIDRGAEGHYANGGLAFCWHEVRRRDITLSWSPDGTKIIFTKLEPDDNDGKYQGMSIGFIYADGTGFTQLTSKSDAEDSYISWSN